MPTVNSIKKTYKKQIKNSHSEYPIIKVIPPSMVKTWGEGMHDHIYYLG